MIFTNLNKELANKRHWIPHPDDIDLLNQAIGAAHFSGRRFRVGAAAPGYNAQPNCSEFHAEARLFLENKSVEPKPHVVAVARLGRRGDWRCSYPCHNCLTLLRSHSISRLVCFNEQGQPVAMEI